MFLYLSEHKIGTVFSFGSRRMFTDYIIQPSWVVNLLQCKKITLETAKRLIVKSCQNVTKYLKDLETVEQERIRDQTALESDRVLTVLNRMAKPFVILAEVQLWERQYEADAFRFKFLVLEGPSRIGKTVYARMSLSPPGKGFYELNRAGGVDLDLRGVEPSRHGLIIFDEISPSQVLKQKKVFQAGPTEIQLGQSSTSVYGYSKFFYRVRMACCSSTWFWMLQKLPAKDQEWLEKNSVHIVRTEPLWIDDN